MVTERWDNGSQHKYENPDGDQSGLCFFDSFRATRGGCPFSVLAPRKFLRSVLLALGAFSIHRSGLEAALFQPALDLVLGEVNVLAPCGRVIQTIAIY